MREENARLRDENEQLRRWQSIALTLDSENRRLKTALRWIPDPEASYVTARVVADAGGVYAKAVLLSVGPNHGLRKGQIAFDERGLVGRITEVGSRTARVLLITDMNSRVPVILEGSRSRAILAGTNGPWPRLLYWSEGTVPQEGERVVTSAEANAFPANLPVGTVRYNANGVPEVEPDAQLRALDIVRIFDYGLTGFAPPEATARADPRTTLMARADRVPGVRPQLTIGRRLDIAVAIRVSRHDELAADADFPRPFRDLGAGSTIAHRGGDLRMVLVAVQAGGDGTAGCISDRAVAGPSGLPAIGRGRCDHVDHARDRPKTATLPVQTGFRGGMVHFHGGRVRHRGDELGSRIRPDVQCDAGRTGVVSGRPGRGDVSGSRHPTVSRSSLHRRSGSRLMRRESPRASVFTRRALLVGGAQTLLLGGLAARLRQVQVEEGDRYTTMAEDNRVMARMVAPQRGRILDRFGIVLAGSLINFRALLLTEQTVDVHRSLDNLSRIVVSDRHRTRADRPGPAARQEFHSNPGEGIPEPGNDDDDRGERTRSARYRHRCRNQPVPIIIHTILPTSLVMSRHRTRAT